MAVPAPTRVGIKLNWAMYRKAGGATVGGIYHFTGAAWTNEAEFDAMSDWLKDQFKLVLSASATITKTTGYNPGSRIPVYEKTYSQAGSIADSSSTKLTPSDCAMLLRFSTDQRTSKNHPIYLFKYIKPAMNNPNTSVEAVSPSVLTAIETLGGSLVTGHDPGSGVRKLCGPFGAVALGHQASTYITHRDFVS